MISGILHKRVYSIGGKPELVIYSDSSTGLDTIELRNELDPTIIPENDAVEIFLLGGVMADKVSVEISSSSSIIFIPPFLNIIINITNILIVKITFVIMTSNFTISFFYWTSD